jgi:hypothetical protein
MLLREGNSQSCEIAESARHKICRVTVQIGFWLEISSLLEGGLV